MNKIKIWLGTFQGNSKEYLLYFEEETECNFNKDIQELEYDLDFIGIIPLFDKFLNIEELVKETPLGKKSREELVRQCHKMDIHYGNAIFFYSGDTRHIEIGEIFNQLVYVGEYNPQIKVMFLVCCEKNVNNLTIEYIKALTS